MRKLRIAMTVDPEIPVPPTLYGGIERIVDMLVRELQRRGHEVHLFANPQSTASPNLAPYPAASSPSLRDTLTNMKHVMSYIRQNGPFDLAHSFARLAYLLPLMPTSIPKIQSYQRFISPRSVRLGIALSHGSLMFTSCSAANAAPVQNIGAKWSIIHNGVETSKYDFVSNVLQDAPLVFLGRVERIKGAHIAIEAAHKTGRRLIIAGNHATSGDEADYFTNEILPQCDGEQITYLGPVDDLQKNELLGKAAAMLFPIGWDEPFGIVMVEALACGTPVIAFNRGSVPEVLEDAKTGFICTTIDQMTYGIENIGQIDRKACRDNFEIRFSEKVITDAYEELYYSVTKSGSAPYS